MGQLYEWIAEQADPTCPPLARHGYIVVDSMLDDESARQRIQWQIAQTLGCKPAHITVAPVESYYDPEGDQWAVAVLPEVLDQPAPRTSDTVIPWPGRDIQRTARAIRRRAR